MRLALMTMCAVACLAACSNEGTEQQATASEPHYEVKLYLPSETSKALRPIIAHFNSEGRKTSDGTRISLNELQSDGTLPIPRILSEKGDDAILWLAPSSLAIDALKGSIDGDTLSVTECRPLAHTDVGAATRVSDDFTVEQYEATGLFAQFLSPAPTLDPAKVPVIFSGLPSTSSSGLAVFTMTAASALKVRIESLSPDGVHAGIEPIRAAQRRIARYFTSDAQMLRWLSSQDGGQPAVALTTRQQVLAQNRVSQKQRLNFVRATVPQLSLDYPLCSIVHRQLAPGRLEAQRAAFGFLSSPGVKDALTALGFNSPDDAMQPPPVMQPGSEKAVLSIWQRARKPSLTVFLLDTSSRLPPEVASVLKRELHYLSMRESVSGDSLAIVATSTRPELLAAPSADLATFRESLKNIRASGASAFRDGMAMAMSLVAEAPASDLRSAIVAVVTSGDVASGTSPATLRARAISAISRRATALYVIAVKEPNPNTQVDPLASLPGLVSDLGGTYLEIRPGELPTTLRGVFQDVE